MNVFIVFVKFLGWIVIIWVRLGRFIEKKGPKVLEGSPITKIKHIITIKKNSFGPRWGPKHIITKKKILLDPRGPGPPPRSVPYLS